MKRWLPLALLAAGCIDVDALSSAYDGNPLVDHAVLGDMGKVHALDASVDAGLDASVPSCTLSMMAKTGQMVASSTGVAVAQLETAAPLTFVIAYEESSNGKLHGETYDTTTGMLVNLATSSTSAQPHISKGSSGGLATSTAYAGVLSMTDSTTSAAFVESLARNGAPATQLSACGDATNAGPSIVDVANNGNGQWVSFVLAGNVLCTQGVNPFPTPGSSGMPPSYVEVARADAVTGARISSPFGSSDVYYVWSQKGQSTDMSTAPSFGTYARTGTNTNGVPTLAAPPVSITTSQLTELAIDSDASGLVVAGLASGELEVLFSNIPGNLATSLAPMNTSASGTVGVAIGNGAVMTTYTDSTGVEALLLGTHGGKLASMTLASTGRNPQVAYGSDTNTGTFVVTWVDAMSYGNIATITCSP